MRSDREITRSNRRNTSEIPTICAIPCGPSREHTDSAEFSRGIGVRLRGLEKKAAPVLLTGGGVVAVVASSAVLLTEGGVVALVTSSAVLLTEGVVVAVVESSAVLLTVDWRRE